MTVKIISAPNTKKGRVFSDAVTRYAGDIVSGAHYIEQHFFTDQTAMEKFHSMKMRSLMDKEMLELIGYVPEKIGHVPEKVTAWTDGTVTIGVNEDFMARYKTVEALEGLAIHALAHADDHLERCFMLPAVDMDAVSFINGSIPVKHLTDGERYKLFR